jgi:hypothetical protein
MGTFSLCKRGDIIALLQQREVGGCSCTAILSP